ncbi:hypothetical protein [Pseudodonghicola xiamenensis]|uniref:hypothetical protein n=1 Tax=Pseudodonghicola xiamenensis TaxID=337702 RepID=UPI0012B507FD|nr:hypothetical protein [Pseudodonghicola xiamenensis]
MDDPARRGQVAVGEVDEGAGGGLRKMKARPVGRALMWCYFELVNGSTANSELQHDFTTHLRIQVAIDRASFDFVPD